MVQLTPTDSIPLSKWLQTSPSSLERRVCHRRHLLKRTEKCKYKFTRICSVLLKLHSGSKFIAAYILPRLEGDLWKTIEKNSSQMQLANLSALQGKKAVKCVCVGCIDLMNNVVHKTCNWVPAMDVAYQYISILTYHTRRFTPSASGSLPLQVARN